MIKVPDFCWFVQEQGGYYATNEFCGSIGTDPKTGCMNQTLFNYKVSIVMTKEGPTAIRAEYYWSYPWNRGGGRSEVVSTELELAEENLPKAIDWLMEHYHNEKKD